MELEPVFLLAAKAGALEGYLFERKDVEPLSNWIDNIARMYQDLSPELRQALAPVLRPVLERTLKYGNAVLETALKEKLERML